MNGTISAASTFFHPDYTVGLGVSPNLLLFFAERKLAGFTASRELAYARAFSPGIRRTLP